MFFYFFNNITSKGFIGLQVHGIGNDKKKEGKEVALKNIKIITKDIDRYKKSILLNPKLTKETYY